MVYTVTEKLNLKLKLGLLCPVASNSRNKSIGEIDNTTQNLSVCHQKKLFPTRH